jgi:hypothetical protein
MRAWAKDLPKVSNRASADKGRPIYPLLRAILADRSPRLGRTKGAGEPWRGIKFGRKLKLTAHQIQEAVAPTATGEALVDIGRF